MSMQIQPGSFWAMPYTAIGVVNGEACPLPAIDLIPMDTYQLMGQSSPSSTESQPAKLAADELSKTAAKPGRKWGALCLEGLIGGILLTVLK